MLDGKMKPARLLSCRYNYIAMCSQCPLPHGVCPKSSSTGFPLYVYHVLYRAEQQLLKVALPDGFEFLKNSEINTLYFIVIIYCTLVWSNFFVLIAKFRDIRISNLHFVLTDFTTASGNFICWAMQFWKHQEERRRSALDGKLKPAFFSCWYNYIAMCSWCPIPWHMPQIIIDRFPLVSSRPTTS